MSRRRRLRALKEWLFGTPPVPVIVRGSLWFARWQARGRIELKQELREAQRVASARGAQVDRLRAAIRALHLWAAREGIGLDNAEVQRWADAVLRAKESSPDQMFVR